MFNDVYSFLTFVLFRSSRRAAEVRPRVAWVYNFVVQGTFWRSKNSSRDKFLQQMYFTENFEANWTISFKTRAN